MDNELSFCGFGRTPADTSSYALIRFRTALGPFTGQMSPRNRAISAVIWLLLFPAGIYGLWILRRHPAAQLVVLAYAGYNRSRHVCGEDFYLRYRLPIETMLCGLRRDRFCRWMERPRCGALHQIRLL